MADTPADSSRRRRPRADGVVAGVALAIAAAAGAGALVLSADSPERQASAAAQTVARLEPEQQPLLVPRRRSRPQVVEPVAGEPAASRPDAPLPAIDAGPAPPPPSDAEIKAELSQLKAVEAKYDFQQLDFSGTLLGAGSLPRSGWQQSIASVYTDYGLPIACGGRLKPEQLGVAHKSLPCGTMVTIRYGNRAIRVPVIDRGPYIAGRVWDLTGATAAALKFPGLGVVQWTLDA
ncbi:MAG: septal ring lytic transglycosylase RlpA family protein [Solirubrobacteraceae bacterium]